MLLQNNSMRVTLHNIERGFKRYVLGELGRGASGKIYRCGRDKVIKYYRDGISTQEGAILTNNPSEMFVNAYEYTDKYLIMERLGNIIGHHKYGIQRVESPYELEYFLTHVGSELQERRIEHRDITPANIAFDPKKGIYKLLDFDKSTQGNIFVGPHYQPSEVRYSTDDAVALEKLSSELQLLIKTVRHPVRSYPHYS